MELFKTSLISDANIKAYYRFISGALTTDSSGQGHTLTNNGTIVNGTGKFGSAADAGTSNSTKYFNIEDNLDIDGGACSMSIWVKLNTEIGDGATYEFLCQMSANNKVYNRLYYYRTGSTYSLHFLRGRIGIADTDSSVTITALGTSNWHHIVYTYDNTNIRGYLDNVLITGPTAASGTGNNSSTTDRFLVGAYKFGSGSAFNLNNTLWDDVSVFNKALSTAEINALYYNLTDGLKGYWKCNETAWAGSANEVKDSSGNAEHGIAVGGATTNSAGKLGRCGILDGSDDRVDCGTIALAGTNTCSMQCWFKCADGEFDDIKALCGENEICWLQGGYPAVGDGRFTVNNGSTWFAVEYNSADLDDGNWHHLVGTYEGVKVHLYVDGTEFGTGTSCTGNLKTDGTFKIGADASNNIEFGGSIDEVAIWNRALSATEVTKLYNSGNAYDMVRDIVKIWNVAIASIQEVSDTDTGKIRTVNNVLPN